MKTYIMTSAFLGSYRKGSATRQQHDNASVLAEKIWDTSHVRGLKDGRTEIFKQRRKSIDDWLFLRESSNKIQDPVACTLHWLLFSIMGVVRESSSSNLT